MSKCPFIFKDNTETTVDITFNYAFEMIDSISTVTLDNDFNTGLSINQSPKIPGLILNLGGRSSNSNMAISVNGKTTAFNVYDAYITKNFPIIKNKDNAYSFVIEGFSSQNISGEKILVFIPLNKMQNAPSEFNSVISALKSPDTNTLNTNSLGLNIDFNKFIPNEPFYYYNFTDSSQTMYNIVAFDNSLLKYDPGFETLLKSNIDDQKKFTEYKEKIGTGDKALNTTMLYKSKYNPYNKDAISQSFEDNIYIDCQPTDNLEKHDNYMQTTVKEAVGLIKYLELSLPYLIFIICLTLIVIAIFSISYFLNNINKPKTDTS